MTSTDVQEPMQNLTLQIGNWRLDPHANLVADEHHSTQLEHKQVQLLLYLIAHSGSTVSKQTLLAEIWNGRVVVDDVVAVAISRLRKAFNDSARAPQYIKTIPGIGYQFIHPVSAATMTLAEQHYRGTLDYAAATDERGPLAAKEKLPINRWRKALGLFAVISIGILLVANAYRATQHTAAAQPEPVNSTSDTLFSKDLIETYQHARELRNSFAPENTRQAINLLQDIIHNEPEFADAYVQLALAKSDLLFQQPLIKYNASEELKALIEKALRINPESSFAHETLGMILLFVDWDYEAARYHLEKALALDPDNAEAHHTYGLYLLAQGKFEESYREVQLARQLNPLNYSIATVAWIYAMQGRYDESWKETEKLLTFHPDDLQYHRSALRLFEAAGDEQKAYIHLRKILALAEYHTEVLENLDRIFAEKQLSGVYRWLAYEHPEERDIGFYLPPLSYARFAIAAGEYDDAFAWLNQAYEQRQGYLVWLAVDPKYKPLHQDPRWGELLEKVGLRVQHQ
jgi:DNA-binding winged helix-turn-helix (wHTH) protein/Flp pilus assembly protein TadD